MAKKNSTLAGLVGKSVGVENTVCFEQAEQGVEIRVFGILEVTEEPESEPRYYVRINETYSGASGIGFRADDVVMIDDRFNYTAIVLR